MFFGLSSSLFNPFRSLYIRELGASALIIGLMDSISNLILAFIRIPGAYIADKHGRRKVIVLFTFTAALSYIFYIFAWDWKIIMLAMMISSLSHIYQPALEAIEADSLPSEKRGIGYTLIWLLPAIPAFIGPIISGYYVETYGLVVGMRIVYILVFFFVLAVASVRWLFLKETIEITDTLGSKELLSSFSESIGSLKEAWNVVDRDVKTVTYVFLLMSFEFPLFMTYYSLFAFDVVGISGLEWGLVTTIGTLVMLVAGIPAGKYIDSIGRKRSLIIGYLISIPTLIVFTMVRGYSQMVFVNICFQVSSVFFFPALSALRADIIPQDLRGRIMGLMGTLRSLAMVPAGAVFGLLYEINKSYPYYLGLVIEVITVIIILKYITEPVK
jgi:MFS family permease